MCSSIVFELPRTRFTASFTVPLAELISAVEREVCEICHLVERRVPAPLARLISTFVWPRAELQKRVFLLLQHQRFAFRMQLCREEDPEERSWRSFHSFQPFGQINLGQKSLSIRCCTRRICILDFGSWNVESHFELDDNRDATVQVFGLFPK